MAITIDPANAKTITLTLTGLVENKEGHEIAAEINSLVAYYNTILDARPADDNPEKHITATDT